VLKKQDGLLRSLALPYPPGVRSSFGNDPVGQTLAHILKVVDFYEEKIKQIGARIGDPKNVMKVVADDIEANGLYEAQELRETTPQ
jgi:hypothetical protein